MLKHANINFKKVARLKISYSDFCRLWEIEETLSESSQICEFAKFDTIITLKLAYNPI
jgi:hypothetical protein